MIRFDQVYKKYNEGRPDETVALQDVSFEIQEGELVILKGASGSGKSTLLSLLSVLTKPSSGAIFAGEQCVSKLPDHFASIYRRERIGMIFQQFNLIPGLSVMDNIMVPVIPVKDKAGAIRRISELMVRFDIGDKKRKLVNQLSGGEQQRVAIVRSLANDPDIVLADEPTANLDAALAEQFMKTVKAVHADGKTVIIATHDDRFLSMKPEARVLMVENGRVF